MSKKHSYVFDFFFVHFLKDLKIYHEMCSIGTKISYRSNDFAQFRAVSYFNFL